MVPKDHYIDLADGKFNLTNANDLEQVFKALEQSARKDSLVVHFHGGLVSRAQAEAAAEGLMPYYEAGGAFPVFFFWRSDLYTTFSKSLNQIAKEPVFKRLVKRLVQLALAKLIPHVGGRSAGNLPQEDDETMPEELEDLAAYAATKEPDRSKIEGVALSHQQLGDAETALEQDDVIQTESRAIAVHAAPPATESGAGTRGGAGRGDVTPRPTLMSKSVVDELVEEQGGAGARIGVLTFATLAVRGALALKRVIDRFGAGRDHTLYTTIVEDDELYRDPRRAN